MLEWDCVACQSDKLFVGWPCFLAYSIKLLLILLTVPSAWLCGSCRAHFQTSYLHPDVPPSCVRELTLAPTAVTVNSLDSFSAPV